MDNGAIRVALLTAIAGVIGTGLGASLQGFWSSKLEQQKFEAQLISNALNSPNRAEAAKVLTFMLDIGLLNNLNETKIRMHAESPETLPIYFHKGIKEGLISVRDAKLILLRVGDYNGQIDDITDQEFSNAVKRFQKQNGLIPDGELGPETARALLSGGRK